MADSKLLVPRKRQFKLGPVHSEKGKNGSRSNRFSGLVFYFSPQWRYSPASFFGNAYAILLSELALRLQLAGSSLKIMRGS